MQLVLHEIISRLDMAASNHEAASSVPLRRREVMMKMRMALRRIDRESAKWCSSI